MNDSRITVWLELFSDSLNYYENGVLKEKVDKVGENVLTHSYNEGSHLISLSFSKKSSYEGNSLLIKKILIEGLKGSGFTDCIKCPEV